MHSSAPFQFVGVVHLLALPGAPGPSPGFAAVRARALADAAVLAAGGATGVILENFGDAPFAREAVEPHVVAAMAVLAADIRERHPGLALGINVLRNDARAALGIAAAVGARWVRVNVLAGAAVTDQGLIQGDAHGWLRYRREVGAEGVGILADVHVKHARPLAGGPIGEAAADLVHRAGASVLVVTGRATGAEVDAAELQAVQAAVPGAPVWLGSGVTEASAAAWRGQVQGAIVGTALHAGSDVRAPLELARVERMARALLG